MKKVTYEQFLSFNPYWIESEYVKQELGDFKLWWGDGKTALDVLSLEEVETDDRFWTVLRPEFIDEPILHEFACRCAERALSYVDNPDPRSIAAIEAKRAWLRGEISDDELCVARDEAWDEAWEVAHSIAQSATWEVAQFVAWDATWNTAEFAAQSAAWDEAWSATWEVAREGGWDKERQWQMDELRQMIQE